MANHRTRFIAGPRGGIASCGVLGQARSPTARPPARPPAGLPASLLAKVPPGGPDITPSLPAGPLHLAAHLEADPVALLGRQRTSYAVGERGDSDQGLSHRDGGELLGGHLARRGLGLLVGQGRDEVLRGGGTVPPRRRVAGPSSGA